MRRTRQKQPLWHRRGSQVGRSRVAQSRLGRHRSGLTLLEMMLVLSLMVMVYAMVSPRLAGTVAGRRLRYAAEEVRTAWAKGRTRAMRSGEIQKFLYLPASRNYLIVPASDTPEGEMTYELASTALAAMAGAIDDQQVQNQWDQLQAAGIAVGRLPVAVTFLDQALAPAVGVSAVMPSSSPDGIGAVVFRPDGTSSNSVVWVTNENDEAIPVQVRGITGMATVGEPVFGITGSRDG